VATDSGLTLRSLFEGTLERFGARPAVRVDDRELTYRDIAGAANRLAHILVGHGVRPGSPVALAVPNRLEWVVADQAIIRVGAAKVPAAVAGDLEEGNLAAERRHHAESLPSARR
jgi:fatty-acyl-CoA synthase